jgi:hypothetical protein
MRSALVLVGGAILVLSFFAHAIFGWKAVGGALRAAGTPGELMTDVAAVWFLSNTAMAAFGLVTIVSGLRLRRGDRSGVAALRILGVAYALYGAAAFVLTGYNPHFFLLFVLPGCLLAVPTFP